MGKIGLPEWAVRLVYKFVDAEKYSPTVDERVLEYSFAIGKLVKLDPGNLLDIGCVARMNLIPAVACELGWKVWGIDVRDYNFKHPNFTFVKGGILDNKFPLNTFNAVTAISTIEHIGTKGRYGLTKAVPEGDLSTFSRVRDVLKEGGKLIVTVPVNSSYKQGALGRTYDEKHLAQLYVKWKILDKRITGKLAMLELQK